VGTISFQLAKTKCIVEKQGRSSVEYCGGERKKGGLWLWGGGGGGGNPGEVLGGMEAGGFGWGGGKAKGGGSHIKGSKIRHGRKWKLSLPGLLGYLLLKRGPGKRPEIRWVLLGKGQSCKTSYPVSARKNYVVPKQRKKAASEKKIRLRSSTPAKSGRDAARVFKNFYSIKKAAMAGIIKLRGHRSAHKYQSRKLFKDGSLETQGYWETLTCRQPRGRSN